MFQPLNGITQTVLHIWKQCKTFRRLDDWLRKYDSHNYLLIPLTHLSGTYILSAHVFQVNTATEYTRRTRPKTYRRVATNMSMASN